MKRIFAGMLSLSLFTLASADPLTMDIGTFAIDDYLGNGNGLPNLNYSRAGAANFYSAARDIIPTYSSITAMPTHAMRLSETQVTKSAFYNLGTAYGEREYNDFILFMGHGLIGGFYLGGGSQYGGVGPPELTLGVGYNKWFMSNSCITFNSQAGPAPTWGPAFKGLRAMLGFKSVTFDNHVSLPLYTEFWKNWTIREKSLLNSFFDAQSLYGYGHLYPDAGLEPGCLSAQVPSMTMDHCRMAYKYVANNHDRANHGAGYFYSRKIGKPMY